MANTRVFKMSDTMYEGLRQAVQYWLPALGTFYFTLSGIWGFPYGEQVVGTIAAITVFLGVIIGITRNSYNKSDDRFDGSLVVDHGELQKLEVDGPVDQLAKKGEMTLRVDKPNIS